MILRFAIEILDNSYFLGQYPHIANIFGGIYMAQLHFYIPDATAEKIKSKAEKSHMTVSKYLAELAKRELDDEWPENYFDIFGQWQGETLQRSQQPDLESRVAFD